jgi:hypothetical protein
VSLLPNTGPSDQPTSALIAVTQTSSARECTCPRPPLNERSQPRVRAARLALAPLPHSFPLAFYKSVMTVNNFGFKSFFVKNCGPCQTEVKPSSATPRAGDSGVGGVGLKSSRKRLRGT